MGVKEKKAKTIKAAGGKEVNSKNDEADIGESEESTAIVRSALSNVEASGSITGARKRHQKQTSAEAVAGDSDPDALLTKPKRARRAAATRKEKTIIENDAFLSASDDDDEFVEKGDDSSGTETDFYDDDDDDEAPKGRKKKTNSKSTSAKRLKEPKIDKVPKAKKIKIEEDAVNTLLTSFSASDDPYEKSQLASVPNPFYNYSDPNSTRKIGNNLKDKLTHLFGYNQERLTGMLKLNEKLNFNILHLSLDAMIDLQLKEVKSSVSFTDSDLKSLSFEEYHTKFPLTNSANIIHNLQEKSITLDPGAFSPFIDTDSSRQGIALNCGGLPIDIAWSHQSNSANQANPRFQYLAVSVCNIFDITDERFSIFAPKGNVNNLNGLQLYQLDTQENKLSLVRSYISTFGVLSNLKWFPYDAGADDVIGVLGAVYGDGLIRFLKIKSKNDIEFCEICTASKAVEVPDTRITCFDFVSNESVVFGTQNGYLGEYNLKTESLSYLYPLMTHGITIITSNFSDYYHDKNPEFENGEYELKTKVVFVGSVDLALYVDLNDIINAKADSIRSRALITQCSYIPQMHLFAVNDGSRVTKIFSKRDCQTFISISKNDGVASGLATSRLHPMLLTASSDGEVFLADSLRRIFSTKKSQLALNFPTARVLKLEYSSKQDCFRFVTANVVEIVGNKEVDIEFVFNSSKVCINAVSWNENIRNGNWYAAASTGGLVFLDKVSSVTAVKHYNDESE